MLLENIVGAVLLQHATANIASSFGLQRKCRSSPQWW